VYQSQGPPDLPGAGLANPAGPGVDSGTNADLDTAADAIVLASVKVTTPEGVNAHDTLADINVVGPKKGGGTDSPPPAILIGLTRQLPFGVMATRSLPDLCVTGRQTRALPPRRS